MTLLPVYTYIIVLFNVINNVAAYPPSIKEHLSNLGLLLISLGTIRFFDGDIYEGNFSDDEPSGQGKLFTSFPLCFCDSNISHSKNTILV